LHNKKTYRNQRILEMAKRKCPQNPQQDGVCGCPSFWRHLKAPTKSNNKSMCTPNTKFSPATLFTKNDRDEDSDPYDRKRQKREDSVLPQAGVLGLSPSESLAYRSSKLGIGEYDGLKQITAKADRRARKSGSARKKTQMANTHVRMLVDYDLPTGDERLQWDTDEVRRMVGEIA
jgi:hypothetical protein